MYLKKTTMSGGTNEINFGKIEVTAEVFFFVFRKINKKQNALETKCLKKFTVPTF